MNSQINKERIKLVNLLIDQKKGLDVEAEIQETKKQIANQLKKGVNHVYKI